jgi:hypothetical protein
MCPDRFSDWKEFKNWNEQKTEKVRLFVLRIDEFLSRTRRMKVAILPLLASLGFISCGDASTSTNGTGGPGEGATSPVVTPQAYVQARVAPGTDAASCGLASPETFNVGEPSVKSGSNLPDGSKFAVTCRVAPRSSEGAFDVVVEASTPTRSLKVQGPFTSATKSIASVELVMSTGKFAQSDCEVSYDSQISGVAAGRIWATVTCARATAPGHTCSAKAEFRFENCSQN